MMPPRLSVVALTRQLVGEAVPFPQVSCRQRAARSFASRIPQSPHTLGAGEVLSVPAAEILVPEVRAIGHLAAPWRTKSPFLQVSGN